MTSPSANVRSRGEEFTPRLSTKITQEVANPENPYLVDSVRIHGYDHRDMIEQCQLSDAIYLLLRGELPNAKERELFRKLCIALINPGPRHPATQASITAGVGKTMTVNVLPIALSVYGGEFDGAASVENAMRFFRRSSRKPAADIIDQLSNEDSPELPGFGSLYGSPDPYAEQLLNLLTDSKDYPILNWAKQLHTQLAPYNKGILKAGVCAATLAELGFQPRQGNSLLQLIAAPGLLAHGMEYANKPLTSMLFEPDNVYEIDGVDRSECNDLNAEGTQL